MNAAQQLLVMRPEACGKCKFAHRLPNAQGMIQCRFHPPTLFTKVVPEEDGPGLRTACEFPVMPEGEWCGQFVPRLALGH